jgi:uncharacterized protein involved in type VI secretion and phage assembly
MAEERTPSNQPTSARRTSTRPLDPSAAIARIPAGDLNRTEHDTPRIDGMLVGRVADNVDPEGTARVKVELRHPDLGTETTVWCRTIAAGAGAERGIAFLPETGDEVVVGFIGGDTTDPVVFGGLWSSSNPPPHSGVDGRVIATRSGIRIRLDDGEGALTVETGEGRRVILDDDGDACTVEDPHGNVIRLGATGITITSAGALDISATGTIRIDGASLASNTPTATFGGIVTAETVSATNIAGENYTPGTGNVW